MVRLSDLKVYDVFSYGVAEVKFESKLVLVDGRNYDEDVGSNQVGKSSLFDALTTALFEENTRGQIKDDIVNRLKKRGRIEVSVSGGEVVYQRGGENRWYVRVGDKRIELSWNSMRAWIRDNLLGGMSYKEFLLSSWFYQGALNEFVKASDMERKELFIKWFQLDVFLKAREIIKEEIKSVENEIYSVKSKIDEIKRLTSEVVEIDTNELERALSVLERFKNSVYPVSVYRERRREVLSALDSIRKAELVKDIVVKLEDELKEIEVRLSQLRLRLKYIGEDKCWVCNSVIDGRRLRREIESEIHGLESRRRMIKEVLAEVDKYRKWFYVSREELLREMVRVRRHVDFSGEYERAKSLVAQWEKVKKMKERLGERIEMYEASLKDLMCRLSLLELWHKHFSDDGIIIYAIKKYFDVFNMFLAYYSDVFRVRVRCDVDKRGRIDIFFADNVKSLKRIDYFSMSERYLISLVLLFAMRSMLYSVGRATNLLVLDEVFSVFDDRWRERLAEFFVQWRNKRASECIVLITHHSDVKSMIDYDEVWWIEKRGGVSRLEVVK